jgi:hypothetical protein
LWLCELALSSYFHHLFPKIDKYKILSNKTNSSCYFSVNFTYLKSMRAVPFWLISRTVDVVEKFQKDLGHSAQNLFHPVWPVIFKNCQIKFSIQCTWVKQRSWKLSSLHCKTTIVVDNPEQLSILVPSLLPKIAHHVFFRSIFDLIVNINEIKKSKLPLYL